MKFCKILFDKINLKFGGFRPRAWPRTAIQKIYLKKYIFSKKLFSQNIFQETFSVSGSRPP